MLDDMRIVLCHLNWPKINFSALGNLWGEIVKQDTHLQFKRKRGKDEKEDHEGFPGV